jgi:urea carboxylase
VAASVSAIEVLAPGTLTTVQDWPGRRGFWHVGVPPSGPMDDRSLRLGNMLLGNDAGAAGLEVTLSGPALRFDAPTAVAVTGAPVAVELDGAPVEQWAPLEVPAGGVLRLSTIRRVGMRAYVLVRGGIGGPRTMGSRSVFVAARLGGRPLERGDVLPLLAPGPAGTPAWSGRGPSFESRRSLRVMLGPHGAPEFLTPVGLDELLAATWRVHHHSDRTGIRLVGPRPAWARADGGEAGLHPSNVLDTAYSVGSVMLAGDTAVIVGPDGPSLGGFTAIAQVIEADRWQLGQLRAGDDVVLAQVDLPSGRGALGRNAPAKDDHGATPRHARCIAHGRSLFDRAQDGAHGQVTYRRAGESAVLVEFGAPVLDLRSRVRAHALAEALAEEHVDGVQSVTAGVRSLHIQYERDRLAAHVLADALARLERDLPPPDDITIQASTVYLPLAWRHSDVTRAIERYQASVRADAPWCPDNIEFIARVNGLSGEDAVREIVLDASYLVVGLGDVYLGAPVAVPIDPCHRLVTTKYNPARTWTPSNAVGIGGVFLCVYGIEGPGGYQLVGRTVPIWHSAEEPPWRLRHFDQLRFVPVDQAELEELRAASEAGRWRPRSAPTQFRLGDYERSLDGRAAEIAAFSARREAAFAAERRAWMAANETVGVAA